MRIQPDRHFNIIRAHFPDCRQEQNILNDTIRRMMKRRRSSPYQCIDLIGAPGSTTISTAYYYLVSTIAIATATTSCSWWMWRRRPAAEGGWDGRTDGRTAVIATVDRQTHTEGSNLTNIGGDGDRRQQLLGVLDTTPVDDNTLYYTLHQS